MVSRHCPLSISNLNLLVLQIIENHDFSDMNKITPIWGEQVD